MAQNFIQRGEILTLPAAPYALDPGDGALVGSIFGVSQNASLIGAECVLAVTGVHRLPKVLTPDVFAIGDPVYWDSGDRVTTDVDTGNTRIGVAVAAAGTSDTTVDVRLHGAW
jgi:predicted RecA/RadA family phage recombinase